MTHSKGPQVELEPGAAAERTEPFVHADALPTELTVAKTRLLKCMIRLAMIATVIRHSKYCIQMSLFKKKNKKNLILN